MTRPIQTERLSLRPFVAADGEAVIDLLNDFEVSRWTSAIPHPFTRSDLRIVHPDGSTRWPGLIAVTREDAVIGGVSTRTHLGYWIARSHWGRGYGREAATAVVTMLFDDPSRNSLISGYFLGNEASARILTGLGFRPTGKSQQVCRAQNCVLAHCDMALTRAAWEARHA
ncbi:GNAT family N-acetyltransferase [Actibacterium sp. 188UL27-1]|uniref:GNAT family N-acetyltransferase n=1 Tax=Actibacterium sp. 188UL27-1 TaxID=2786961 RepID=UPI00195B637A|nr:GNAT family N-acetyltransferase [Actibacterium sp. 188UL27-1]MBM7067613.1 GNAT family N-acetyltransferase [Actibacterium sp. 188UL27-1]